MRLQQDQQDLSSLSSDDNSVIMDAAPADLAAPLQTLAKEINHGGSDYYFSNLEFESVDDDTAYVLMILWRLLVGVAGLLDCCAGLVLLLPSSDHANQYAATRWLYQHSNRLGIIFSCVWFCDAILCAYQKQKDRQSDCDEEETHGSASNKLTKASMDRYPSLRLIFSRLILLQLLVLPVGVYISLYRMLLKLANRPLWDETTDPIVLVHHDEGKQPTEENSTALATDTILSFTIVFLRHVWIRLSHLVAKYMSKGRARLIRKALVLLIQFFFRNPILFNKRVKMTQILLNWSKYAAKLADKLNLLIQKAIAVRMNSAQWWKSKLARRARLRLRRSLSSKSLQDYSATLIAATFRRYLAQCEVKRMRLQNGLKQTAARKVQACVRRRMWRARRQLRAEQRLESYCKKDGVAQLLEHSKKNSKLLLELDSNMKHDVSVLVNDRMLLAPNSPFSIAWGLIVVFAVLSEATSLAVNPILEARSKSDKDLPGSLKDFLTEYFIPVSVAHNPLCREHKVHKWMQPCVDLFRHLTKQAPPGASPWWCQSPAFASIQGMYIMVASRAIQNFTTVRSIILFLDVVITFFTGEFDRNTGILRPMSIMRRWIFPGLLFQFLINPHIEPAVIFLRKLATFMVLRGVVRVYQWCVVSLYPLVRLLLAAGKRLRCSVVTTYASLLPPSWMPDKVAIQPQPIEEPTS